MFPEDSVRERYSARKNCQCLWKQDWFSFLTVLANHKDSQSFKIYSQPPRRALSVNFFPTAFVWFFLADISDVFCLADVPWKMSESLEIFCSKLYPFTSWKFCDLENCDLEEINRDLLKIMIHVKNRALRL